MRNMQLVDTNVILRYVLQDHEDFYKQAKMLMESRDIVIPVEVVAETVYVLEKVYKTPRTEIREMLVTLHAYDNLTFIEGEVVMAALSLYCQLRLDFVDTILCSYHQVNKAEVHSFDKGVNRFLKSQQ